jgi:hypothetical protein
MFRNPAFRGAAACHNEKKAGDDKPTRNANLTHDHPRRGCLATHPGMILTLKACNRNANLCAR